MSGKAKHTSSPTEVVVQAVNELGLQRAAKQFHTSPATLSRWLKAQHYKIKRIYVREEPPRDDLAIARQIVEEQLEKFGIADGVVIEMEIEAS
jgi:hypothetical protein